MGQFPHAYKAGQGTDLDLPLYDQAMSGPHQESFHEACKVELQELFGCGTFELVRKSDVPEGVKILPSTWAFHIKRYPDGRLRKFKARFCICGDKQVEGINYFEKYAPVISWSTVRMMLCLAASQNLSTRQVNFDNAFAQAHLREDEQLYIQAPHGYHSNTNEPVILKLNRSLYGLIQAAYYWGEHLQAGLDSVSLKPSNRDPCMYISQDVIALTYIDDCLFFG